MVSTRDIVRLPFGHESLPAHETQIERVYPGRINGRSYHDGRFDRLSSAFVAGSF